MRKIVLLITCLMFLSGCQAEYNLKLQNGNISEEIIIIGSGDEEINNIKKYQQNNTAFVDDQISSETNEKIEGVEYYQQSILNNKLKLNYGFKDNNFLRSNSVNSCYQFFNYVDEKNNHTISTSKEFNCFNTYPDLEKVTVNITVDFKVTEHNADGVSGNTYVWNLTRYQSDNSIYIHGDDTKENEGNTGNNSNNVNNSYNSDSVKDEKDGNELVWVLCGLGIFVIVLFMMLKIKKGKE